MTMENFSRSEEEEDGRLLPGLLDEIVFEHVVPKLPWGVFHTLSSVSRRWREESQCGHIYDARARSASTETLFVVNHTDDEEGSAISLYSTRDNYWHRLPPLPKSGKSQKGIPRFCQCIALNSNIYVLGGLRELEYEYVDASSDNLGDSFLLEKTNNDAGDGLCSDVYVLDLVGQTSEWKKCANMPEPRYGFGCGVVDGKIYVLGGFRGRCNPTRESMVYDPKANAWSAISPMQQNRCHHRVVAVGKELFVNSGQTSMDVYHAGKDEWRSQELSRKTEGLFITAQGKLNMATPFGIDGQEIDIVGNVSRRCLHSFPGFGDCLANSSSESDAEIVDVFAANDELLALVTYSVNWELVTGLFRSKGFGTKKEEIVWDMVDSEIMMCHKFKRIMCPIQL